ncbi:MAG: sodium:proton antiporter [Tannerella sp.]|jgi:CPA1 family monovalent cation:H+ antiporter|nr:sodium:proton antiporter [Tannerella sp.]
MELLYTISILIIIATIFSYINIRFLKLPSTIGIMLIAIIFSVILVITGSFSPIPLQKVHHLLDDINFAQLLMGGMLYFLLFAGAIQININDLKEQKISIIVFSTLSVIISTFVVGFGLYYIFRALFPLIGVTTPPLLIYCLLFGALISPTDPIAVLSILKEAKVSKALETKVTGESLFNDGMAVIAFTVIYNIARGTEHVSDITFASISWLLVKEIVGGILVGLTLGYTAFQAMVQTGDSKLSVLITLSVVIGGYIISQAMGISGPLTMVSAGLVVGNANRKYSEIKHLENNFLRTFWELTDNIMNAILFLLIGFELLLVPALQDYWIVGIISIVMVLVARYISIKIPTMIIPFREKYSKETIIMLVWGGLRGGVSIALALSITAEQVYRDTLVAATYFVVVFSIIVQGLTIGKVAKKIRHEEKAPQ